MSLTSEVMRVKARTMLIGRVRCGNLLSLFSAGLRVAVWSLGFLLVLNFKSMIIGTTGKILLFTGAFAAACGAVLLCCVRTAKDKWYASILDDKYMGIEDIIVLFTLRDFADSVVFSLVSAAYSLVRIVSFFAFPAAFAAATYLAVADGVSRNVLAVMLFGNVLFFCCAAFFCGALLNCVSLSRSACVGDVKSFRRVLKKLESCSMKIFRFDIFLSIADRGSRRLAKLILIKNICEENTRQININRK